MPLGIVLLLKGAISLAWVNRILKLNLSRNIRSWSLYIRKVKSVNLEWPLSKKVRFLEDVKKWSWNWAKECKTIMQFSAKLIYRSRWGKGHVFVRNRSCSIFQSHQPWQLLKSAWLVTSKKRSKNLIRKKLKLDKYLTARVWLCFTVSSGKVVSIKVYEPKGGQISITMITCLKPKKFTSKPIADETGVDLDKGLMQRCTLRKEAFLSKFSANFVKICATLAFRS